MHNLDALIKFVCQNQADNQLIMILHKLNKVFISWAVRFAVSFTPGVCMNLSLPGYCNKGCMPVIIG